MVKACLRQSCVDSIFQPTSFKLNKRSTRAFSRELLLNPHLLNRLEINTVTLDDAQVGW